LGNTNINKDKKRSISPKKNILNSDLLGKPKQKNIDKANEEDFERDDDDMSEYQRKLVEKVKNNNVNAQTQRRKMIGNSSSMRYIEGSVLKEPIDQNEITHKPVNTFKQRRDSMYMTLPQKHYRSNSKRNPTFLIYS
jgi:hypothetical protein